jgi:hypothetical protein
MDLLYGLCDDRDSWGDLMLSIYEVKRFLYMYTPFWLFSTVFVFQDTDSYTTLSMNLPCLS